MGIEPEFADENPTVRDDTDATDATPETDDAAPESDPDMIVYRENYVDEAGQPAQREHGPMPVSEWADYEKEHKL